MTNLRDPSSYSLSDGRNTRKTYGSIKVWNHKSKEVPPYHIFPGLYCYMSVTNDNRAKPRKVVVASNVWYYLGVKFVWGYVDGSTELSKISFKKAYII